MTRSVDPSFPRGLYAISNGPRADLLDVCAAALAGGAQILQYRDKTRDHPRRATEALALAKLCRHYRAVLIINDDVALAAAVNADGVHLGEDDADIGQTRAQLGPGAVIGVSCYDSLARAQSAAAAGADYLAFGAFFASPTKPAARHADIELLQQAQTLQRPLVAIGGITMDNAGALIDAGAHAIAVISALFDASDVCATAQHFSGLFSTTDKNYTS
ncbi:MAG: thiamine phosphate synthase [Xanthomonadales bacterium]|nr:thiamine phosphate synthase [Xanthomonadales bacterium]